MERTVFTGGAVFDATGTDPAPGRWSSTATGSSRSAPGGAMTTGPRGS